LYREFTQKVWVLVSEYDAVLNEAFLSFDEIEARKVSCLFEGLYDRALKCNPNLMKGILTAVRFIPLNKLFSEINSISIYDYFNSKVYPFFGLNEKEEELMIEYLSIHSFYMSCYCREWYDGYFIESDTDEMWKKGKINVCSIVNCLNNRTILKPYWKDNSFSKLIFSFIKDKDFRKIIDYLILGEGIVIENLCTDFTLEKLQKLKEMLNLGEKSNLNQSEFDMLFSYLFAGGYLTSTPYKNEYKIPNKEVLEMIWDISIENYYKEAFKLIQTQCNELSDFLIEITTSNLDEDDMAEILAKKFIKMLKKLMEIVMDKQKECNYNIDLIHSILVYCAILTKHYNCPIYNYSKRAFRINGRADIFFSNDDIGLMIEIHKKSEKKLEDERERFDYIYSNNKRMVFIDITISSNNKVEFDHNY
jgi:hypothetical protein